MSPRPARIQPPLVYDPAWTFRRCIENAHTRNPRPDAGYVFIGPDGSETRYTFKALSEEAHRRAQALLAMGLKKGDRLGVVIPEGEGFVLTFFAAAVAGIVPVPLYPPLGFGRLDAYLDTTQRILQTAGARVLVTSSKMQAILWSLMDKVDCLEDIVTVEKLETEPENTYELENLEPEDPVFIQFTSGSTAEPKGVVVTNRSLGANVHGIMTDGLATDPDQDIALTWLPLYHDMGLIGFVISPMEDGIETVHLPTMNFIKRPGSWMRLVDKHRASICFSPNFAFGLARKRTPPAKLENYDLSCLRLLGAGAEPNQPAVLDAFLDHFASAGLAPEVIMPAYGMAEATLAMTFADRETVYDVDYVDPDRYQEDGLAVAVDPDQQRVLEFVSCGRALSGHEVVIVDANGDELGDRQVGEIIFRGPSVAGRYLNNPEATENTFTPLGLRTGDLGYMVEGEVFVTGRKKDLLILNGRNYDPQSVEWVVAEVDGVRTGCVVAFSRPGETSEELVVVVEVKPDADRDVLETAIRDKVRSELFLNPADLLLLDKGLLPKTTSGKLQRAKTRGQYLDGSLGLEGDRSMGHRGQTLTVARHVARSLVSRVKHSLVGKKSEDEGGDR